MLRKQRLAHTEGPRILVSNNTVTPQGTARHLELWPHTKRPPVALLGLASRRLLPSDPHQGFAFSSYHLIKLACLPADMPV